MAKADKATDFTFRFNNDTASVQAAITGYGECPTHNWLLGWNREYFYRVFSWAFF